MPPFHFTLDPLLKARRHEERRRQIEVAELETKRRGLEDALRRQQALIERDRQALRERLVGTLDAGELRLHATAALQQMRRAQRIVPELAVLHQALEAARARLAEAAGRRRALERLRELRREAWRRDRQRAEDAALDDLAAAQAARRETTT